MLTPWGVVVDLICPIFKIIEVLILLVDHWWRHLKMLLMHERLVLNQICIHKSPVIRQKLILLWVLATLDLRLLVNIAILNIIDSRVPMFRHIATLVAEWRWHHKWLRLTWELLLTLNHVEGLISRFVEIMIFNRILTSN